MWFRKNPAKSGAADSPPPSTRARGQRVEQLAEAWLRSQGLKSVERNYTVRGGEIDLIMNDGDTLVFVEVRYRRDDQHGSGAESINMVKQQRLMKAALHYLQAQYGDREPPCRFDVISASGETTTGIPEFDWIRNAF